MSHASTQHLRLPRHLRDTDRCGVCEVVLFLVAVALLCCALAPANPTCGPSCAWLSTALMLWLCTSPAWLFRPTRFEIKHLLTRAAVAFVSVGAAVFVGFALSARIMGGSF
jgi:hypothetical protein